MNANNKVAQKSKSAPRKIKKFSGLIAQIMVFFNGLILTVTAYATINVFVGEMIAESVAQNFAKAENEVIEQIEVVQNIMYMFGGLADGDDGHKILPKAPISMHPAIKDVQNFDRIISAPFKDMQENKRVLYEANRSSVDDALIIEQVRDALEKMKASQKTIQNDFLFKAVVFGEANLTTASLLSAVYVVQDKQKVIIGIAKPEKLFRAKAQALDDLYDMEILLRTDTGETYPLYNHARQQSNEDNDEIVTRAHNFSYQAGGGFFDVRIKIRRNDRDLFLKLVPVILLIFGLTLTAIGTLYVRSNQVQSFKLAFINKELAKKNYDLNVQIKERERLNIALKKSERENRAVMNAVSDIIFQADLDGNFTFLNETWVHVTDIPLKDGLTLNLFNDCLHPQDREDQRENYRLLTEGKKKAYRTYTRLKDVNGVYRAVELAISMILHDTDRRVNVVGMITDIEERKRTEKALNEAEKKYKAIVENIAAGIYQMDKNGRFISANPAMARIFGFDTVQELTKDVKDANASLYKDYRRRKKFLYEVEEAADMKVAEMECVRKDGQVIWIHESTRPVFDTQGMFQFYEGSVEDITQRKRAEIELKEAKVKSDLASRAKSEFLANMSHELRTPLNAIIGFSEVIRDENFGPVGSPYYKEYAQDIYEGGNRLLNIINEILDVSRIETGDRVLNEGLILLKDVTDNCIELLTPKINAGEITVDNMIGAQDIRLVGEKLAVKQMLINLLSNAVKYTAAGGRVSISAELSERGNLHLSVTDTGAGLTEDEIEKALSPFGQVQNAHSRNAYGTGLGLTLVDSLIRMHGGALELLSQKGVGTTATLIFPAERVRKAQNA